jgi:orotate phosphoribosyltransferase
MNTLENLFAEKLLKIKAIKLQPANPFTWASGWKSPFYCDNRKTLSYPALRNFVKTEITRLILEQFGEVDAIAGVATGAIPQGALVADALNLPFVYVRSTPKDHGLENQIEGDLRPRQSVVIVENQINEGSNCSKVVEAIRNNGCKVLGVVTIFNYDFATAKRRMDDIDVSVTALTDFETVIRHASAMGIVDEEQRQTVEAWQQNPENWSK